MNIQQIISLASERKFGEIQPLGCSAERTIELAHTLKVNEVLTKVSEYLIKLDYGRDNSILDLKHGKIVKEILGERVNRLRSLAQTMRSERKTWTGDLTLIFLRMASSYHDNSVGIIACNRFNSILLSSLKNTFLGRDYIGPFGNWKHVQGIYPIIPELDVNLPKFWYIMTQVSA